MKEYPIGLVPGPVSVPLKIREAWLTDFGSSDLEAEFFDLYSQNQTLTRKLLGTKESVVITSGEAMAILWGGVKSEMGKFADLLEKSRKKIQEAGNQMELAARRGRAIERQLKNIEAMPVGEEVLLAEPEEE